ncbi:hypothetical protein ESA94_09635 [Lacibacter luteus]|uniref:Uncharacterized protein n=1 Tax=Lacibacter luteus TaxID=2508719 RepID=A0A4Q1CK17_9BACT|nr:hypothetical protein [Lacibacter luteus]RXK60714.1 hypothetical protein ESA94_09635 [Lacibacter luteus]
MKQYLLLLFFIAAVLACNNEASKEQDAKLSNEVNQPQQWFATDTVVVWDCSAEDKTKKRIYAPIDSVTEPKALINGVNKTYSEIKLEFDHLSGDTLFVKIPAAEWLTERAGNSGAEQYLSFAALNLLETKAIRYVHFDFTAGVHARPTTWSGKDFSDWKKDPSSVQ